MKKLFTLVFLACFTATIFTGCVWSVGSGQKTTAIQPTVGQQLIDLQKAKDSGAITDAEFQQQRAKFLGNK